MAIDMENLETARFAVNLEYCRDFLHLYFGRESFKKISFGKGKMEKWVRIIS
jgi:hypothetical protein